MGIPSIELFKQIHNEASLVGIFQTKLRCTVYRKAISKEDFLPHPT